LEKPEKSALLHVCDTILLQKPMLFRYLLISARFSFSGISFCSCHLN
jgi:hypothetical protein